MLGPAICYLLLVLSPYVSPQLNVPTSASCPPLAANDPAETVAS